jgi:hypothetical protein
LGILGHDDHPTADIKHERQMGIPCRVTMIPVISY